MSLWRRSLLSLKKIAAETGVAGALFLAHFAAVLKMRNSPKALKRKTGQIKASFRFKTL